MPLLDKSEWLRPAFQVCGFSDRVERPPQPRAGGNFSNTEGGPVFLLCGFLRS